MSERVTVTEHADDAASPTRYVVAIDGEPVAEFSDERTGRYMAQAYAGGAQVGIAALEAQVKRERENWDALADAIVGAVHNQQELREDEKP